MKESLHENQTWWSSEKGKYEAFFKPSFPGQKPLHEIIYIEAELAVCMFGIRFPTSEQFTQDLGRAESHLCMCSLSDDQFAKCKINRVQNPPPFADLQRPS